jgi:xylulokinase
MAQPRDVVIGLDASTTACKAVAWDAAGRALADARAPLEIFTPGPDLFEQSATTWWQAACRALREVAQQIPAERLAGMAIAHQRETFVLVDHQGQPLHNAILWMDERSRPYLDFLGQQLGLAEFHQRTGKPLSGNLVIGKLAWLRAHTPQVLERAAYLLDTHAFLIHRLTGTWSTSTASADPLGLYDMQNGGWDLAVMQLLELDPRLLPNAHPPGKQLGVVSPGAASECGLPAGLPVYAGLGDGQAAALGCGISQPGRVSLSLGTSVISGTFAPSFSTDPAFRTMGGGLPGSCILETVLLGGAYTLNWFTSQFLGGQFDPLELERKAAALAPGAQGLLLVPYWNSAMGPYWDASASGIVVGWKGIHHPEHYYRAILEGIGYELRLQLEQVALALHTPLELIVASGGGSRSGLWLQILADLLGTPLERSTSQEAASLGAAMLAAAGAGLHPSIANAAEAMRQPPGDRFTPVPSTNALYTDLFENVYRGLYPALRTSLANLSRLSSTNG